MTKKIWSPQKRCDRKERCLCSPPWTFHVQYHADLPHLSLSSYCFHSFNNDPRIRRSFSRKIRIKFAYSALKSCVKKEHFKEQRKYQNVQWDIFEIVLNQNTRIKKYSICPIGCGGNSEAIIINLGTEVWVRVPKRFLCGESKQILVRNFCYLRFCISGVKHIYLDKG